MSRNTRGISFYLLIVVLVVVILFSMRGGFSVVEESTYNEFTQAVGSGTVSDVQIRQNSEVPTGEVLMTMTDGSERRLYVTDVKEVEELLRENNVNYHLYDIPADSTLLTTLVPVLLMGMFMLFFVIMLNRQSGGGNKMMNFGKSRATMVMPDAKRVRFKDVAGLQEEKEDLKELVDFLPTFVA